MASFIELRASNVKIREEIELFVDINTKQVKVNRNLVNEIVSSLNIEDRVRKVIHL